MKTKYNSNEGGHLGLTVKTLPRYVDEYPILAFSFWGKDRILADDCAQDQTMYTLVTKGGYSIVNLPFS